MQLKNQLGSCESAYLKMHSKNPVAWQLFNEKTFELAKKLKRPIFLSSGYSSCHWCKVMEEESFEDEAIAEILNNKFIPIKIDKEEYPDVDKEYQFYLQSSGNAGGWPLSVFLDTDLKPFYAGTYYPKSPAFDRPSFKEVLLKIDKIYHEKYDEVLAVKKMRDDFMAIFNDVSNLPMPKSDDEFRQFKLNEFRKIFDNENGGFRHGAKFPYVSALLYLIDNANENDDILEFLKLTANAISLRGLYDHINHGFFRYCVDAKWSTPHYEKMLTDNALIPRFLLKLYDITGEKLYLFTAKESIDFVLQNMNGEYGILNSIDADSKNAKGLLSEGYFYKVTDRDFSTLTDDELKRLPDEITITDGSISLKSESYIKRVALQVIFDKVRKRVLATKSTPRLDNKVIAGSNFLFCTTLLTAFEVTSDDSYFEEAKLLFAKVKGLLVEDGKVYRGRYEKSRINHFVLEDQVFYLECLTNFYSITKEMEFLLLINESLKFINENFMNKDGMLTLDTGKRIIDTFDDDKLNPYALYFSIADTEYLSVKFKDIAGFILSDKSKLYLRDRVSRFPTGHPTIKI